MTKFKDQPSMYSLVDKPRKISEDHYLLRIKSVSNESAPGQFITIRASKLTDPLLRRPFSIFNHQENLIDIVVKNVGKCTNILAGYSNDTIDMQGPMGKGFTTIERGKALLVGGGVGNAPLFYLAKKLKDLGNEITFIYGMQSKKYIFQIEQFKNFTNKFSVTTDDGTEGEKGFTTDLAEKFLQKQRIRHDILMRTSHYDETVSRHYRKHSN